MLRALMLLRVKRNIKRGDIERSKARREFGQPEGATDFAYVSNFDPVPKEPIPRLIRDRWIGEIEVNSCRTAQLAVVGALASVLAYPAQLRAQNVGDRMPKAAPQAAALTGGQQSLANQALCSALQTHVSDPASASPSALSNPDVMSMAASTFAGSAKLPVPSATDLLKGYVAQHATDILGSCSAGGATSGLTSKIPGASSLPSMPK